MVETKRKTVRKAIFAAFPHTIPVLTGFLVLGAAYGVLMRTKGYGMLWSVLMSAVAFCGSMQFVAITFLTMAFHPLQAFLMSLMVNTRHLFYGISMLQKYKGLGKIRYFLIFLLCDETFSISSGIVPPADIDRKAFYLSISLLNYLYWVFGTFLGSMLGAVITFNIRGLDFVLTALFVVLFLEQMKKPENRVSGVMGIGCTAAGLWIFGADHMVIPSMCAILFALLLGRKQICC
ncbi:MAG: AzlC family ABC transporter permease [Clostridiaceae bacterium]|nr:AzlC family ABC transporter permease [Clostridiaceae bacterium]